MSRFTGFTRIAASFDPMEIRLAVMVLDGAGFITIAPNLRMTETVPAHSLAFGPLELYVPDADAQSARILLEATAAGPIPTDAMPDAPPAQRKGRIMQLLAFLLAGMSFPLTGLSVERRARDDKDAAG